MEALRNRVLRRVTSKRLTGDQKENEVLAQLLEKVHAARRFLYEHRIARDYVEYGRSVLPAKHLRLGGPEFKDDRFFLASGCREVSRLTEEFGIDSGSRILEIGCGFGRLPIAIQNQLWEPPFYWGLDVNAHCISWCHRHIAQGQPRFIFQRIDVLNKRYNPTGSEIADGFTLPFESGFFNLIYLYSVFSHMTPEHITAYLDEFRRILDRSGLVFMTAFIERDVPDVTENPRDYRMRWSGALHCMRYEQNYFSRLIAQSGFQTETLKYGAETDGQSALYLSRL
jgi:ubiquinone/menaquinone biosynthesis C-methylase UbiE